jgi:hypothetical protein
VGKVQLQLVVGTVVEPLKGIQVSEALHAAGGGGGETEVGGGRKLAGVRQDGRSQGHPKWMAGWGRGMCNRGVQCQEQLFTTLNWMGERRGRGFRLTAAHHNHYRRHGAL